MSFDRTAVKLASHSEGMSHLTCHALDGIGVASLSESLIGDIKAHNNDYGYQQSFQLIGPLILSLT
ncbi:hypothetical protein [Bradyrhizobium elkanii]|uniref:hypothetical protein n=1 Tax=Bradyrhizobium elkanii TaxID=29448 RepID=UPI0012FE4A00|nr:hypothetical protein [Bradyrhizobium elkanii]WLA79962.1 hypothetical protein QNJ99_31870 [Bradyrhizobium elkanii]